MNIVYTFYISDDGAPATGLSPSFLTLKLLSDNSDVSPQPMIAEVASGLYKFTFDPEAVGETVGVIDAGSGIANPGERYVPITLARDSARLLTALPAGETFAFTGGNLQSEADVTSWRGNVVPATNVNGVPIIDIGYSLGEEFKVNDGTAQAGGNDTITLAADASAKDDYYLHQVITTAGGTGSGQSRIITAYNGTTKIATVHRAWVTNPDNTTGYVFGNLGESKLAGFAAGVQTLSERAAGNLETFLFNNDIDTTKVVDDVGTGGNGNGLTVADVWAYADRSLTARVEANITHVDDEEVTAIEGTPSVNLIQWRGSTPDNLDDGKVAVTGTGGGGGEADWTTTERQQIRHRLGIDGTMNPPSATPSLSTYDGSDTSGTTALLSRLTNDRAGHLDKLNVAGTLAHTGNAGMFQADVSGLSTFDPATQTVTVGANNDKSGYELADGTISSAKFNVANPIPGPAAGILEKIDQLWRRAFKTYRKDAENQNLEMLADDSETVLVRQPYFVDEDGNQSIGPGVAP